MKTKRAALYVRVSTVDQSTRPQESALRKYAENRGWTVHQVYRDHGVSGNSTKRPALEQLRSDCRRRRVDVVLVWKFDRFARSLRQLVTSLEEFRAIGIDFVSCTEAIDTSMPSGELVFHIFGAIAQFERCLIGERVRAGLAEARRAGKRIGRPSKKVLNEAEVRRTRKEYASGGCTLRDLAARYGTSVWAIHQAVKGQ